MRAPFLSFCSICSMLLLSFSAAAQQRTPIQPDDFTHEAGNGVTLVKDPLAPLSLELPRGWYLENGIRWGDHETTLQFREMKSFLAASLYYQYPLQTPLSSDAGTALKEFVEAKVRQRREIDGLSDYQVLHGSIHMRKVAGHPALSFYAEFTNPGPTTQYVLHLTGAGIKLLFFVTAAADFAYIDSFVKRLDAVAETLKIPEFPTMNISELPLAGTK